MKKHIQRWKLIFLILLTLLPLAAFFVPGLPHGHDAQDHVVRIANFYQGLTEGIWFPRWGGNLNWGYGHPVMMFLYPCSSYVASLFRFIGFSFVDATKAVFVVAYIGSVLSMYLFMSTVWGKRAGIIGAILYGFAPYRFVDLYVRMAIGEHMAFVFPPLVLYFLYRMAVQKIDKKYVVSSIPYGIGLSVSFGLLILSHNAIALMFLPIIGLYALYLFFFETKHSVFYLLSLLFYFCLGFGLSAFFWIPGFIEGKYTLRNIVTAGEALTRFVPFSSFFYSPWTYGGAATITKEVGLPQWIGIICAGILMIKTKKKDSIFWILGGSIILLIFFLFIMTESSSFIWKHAMILQNFQFPVRFLSPVVFLSALIGGIAIHGVCRLFGEKNMKVQNIFCLVFCLFSIMATSHMWHPKDYQIESESFYTRVYPGTTDTGESTPIWTTRFQEQYPKAPLEIISGQGSIEQTKRTTTIHEYDVTSSERLELMENTLYFPGWTVAIDGKQIVPEFQSEIHRGIMTFWVPEGTHSVRVAFVNTKIRTMAELMTIASLGILGGSAIVYTIWKKRT